MGIFRNILSWLGGSPTSRTPGDQNEGPISGRLTTRNITTDSALQLSAVFACSRLIAETIAALPIKAYKVDPITLERTPYSQHPLRKLLTYKPNRYQTGFEFIEHKGYQLCLHGNAYSRIDRNVTGQIISLLPFMSEQMDVKALDDGSLVYVYYDGKNISFYAPESIWHLKLFGNGIIGMSPIKYAGNAIGVAVAAEDRVSRLANSGFKPSGILMIDKVLKPEQRASIRAQFADLVEGADEALKVLEAGMQYSQTSMNPKDVQLLENRRFQLEDIARFFGVPSVLINDTTATTVWGSGISQIVQGFYKFGLRPYLERIEASIKIHLLPINERETVELEFDFEALLAGDERTRIQGYKEAILSGIKTVNECRRREGDPPIEGGDRAYMQGQMIPLEELGKNTNAGGTV